MLLEKERVGQSKIFCCEKGLLTARVLQINFRFSSFNVFIDHVQNSLKTIYLNRLRKQHLRAPTEFHMVKLRIIT